MFSPSISHRAQKNLQKKLQEGTVVALTTVTNPPASFPKAPRHIALIELKDGSKVMGALTTIEGIGIGQTVRPRMRLQQVNNQGLRIYDVSYEPTVRVKAPLEETFPCYIIALSGPSGVGKSTVSDLLAVTAADYVVRVPIVTTRKRKTGDENEYTYTTPTKFKAMLDRGEIISSTYIPSSGEERQYGYRASDIELIWSNGKIPIVVTEQHLLQGLANHFGRRSILSFGLLPPGKSKRAMLSQLLHRLRIRGRDTETSIVDRMKNAENDLDVFMQKKDLFDHIIVNEQLDSVIDRLKKHIIPLEKAVKPA
jgi:guanylate kinase